MHVNAIAFIWKRNLMGLDELKKERQIDNGMEYWKYVIGIYAITDRLQRYNEF